MRRRFITRKRFSTTVAVRPEAIPDLFFQFVQLLAAAQARQTFVEIEPLIGVGNIVIRKISRDAEANFRIHFRQNFFPLQFLNRFLHHLGVELEAYRGDLPRLLIAQQIARAADFQIVQRQFESTAKPVDFLQRAQAFLGVRRDRLFTGDNK